MKPLLALLLCCLLLGGCTLGTAAPAEYKSRFSSETLILLSPEGITVNGGGETETVYTARDIICHEDRLAYDSGNPYGEAEDWERHTAQEAQAHLVVNITAPGAYRIRGTLPAGQIRVDLGKKADEDPSALVELILEDADITCQVAPAVLFLNVYECDQEKDPDTASAQADTSKAGASLIFQGENKILGSHVARIFKDKEGQKKLWKQDGAIYSYMSMNVYGPGTLRLTADNEGIVTEGHLTIQGGNLLIDSGNDGINANEDEVSVITINGGRIQILAGLRKEGDGIDSNGFLVINGGTVIAQAKPLSDGGLDSVRGTYINGGTVVALGAEKDWVTGASDQGAMNLRFREMQTMGSRIEVRDREGNRVFSFDPKVDSGFDMLREYRGAVLSCPEFAKGAHYELYMDGIRMQYTGTDVEQEPGREAAGQTDFHMQGLLSGFSGISPAQ